jgi:methionyl-tRNA synthetase
MDERRRFYLTTSIAYANNRPGLHTLYEVIGADAIARWHRMCGDRTRFLTGTDEYSVNIAMTAAEQGHSPRAFVDEMVELFRTAEDALGIAPDRFIRTTDPDHQRAVHEIIRRCHANGDLYPGTYEGWYCPNEGFRTQSDLVEDATGVHCPNHPDVELQWLSEQNWFFRLSRYQEPLERYFAEDPDWVEPEYRRNEMLAFIRGGLEDFSCPTAPPRSDPTARGTRRPGPSTSGSMRSSTTSRVPDSPATPRHSRSGGRVTCTSSARTSTDSTR